MDWSSFFLGVLVLPTVSAAFLGLIRLEAALRRRGYTATIRWTRRPDDIGDYMLRHDIWWERAFGPVFAGGWYHESLRDHARINRWVGFGRTEGPCLALFKSRDLGPVNQP